MIELYNSNIYTLSELYNSYEINIMLALGIIRFIKKYADIFEENYIDKL